VLALADSHMHLFRQGFAGVYGRSPAGSGDEVDVYETFRSAHNIVAALVVGYEGAGIDPTNNSYLRSLAGARGWMFTAAFVAADPPPEPDQLDRLLAAGHRGISLYLTDAQAAGSVLQWAPGAWAVLEEQRAVVSVNAGPDAMAAVASLAGRHSGCSFLISHLGDPGGFRDTPAVAEARERIGPLLSLSAHDNAYVKISGLYAISDPPHDYPHHQATPFVRLALEAFGPRRCLWGSDFSPCLDHVSFAQVANPCQLAGLTEYDLACVMGGNLLGLLGFAKN
jgi:L-fuconolactonase